MPYIQYQQTVSTMNISQSRIPSRIYEDRRGVELKAREADKTRGV